MGQLKRITTFGASPGRRFLSLLGVAGLLFSAALAYAAPQPVQAATASGSVCSGISVGPEQEVVSNAARSQIGAWSDIQQGVLRNADGSYSFFGTSDTGGSNPQHPQRPVVARGTLDNPLVNGWQSPQAIANVPAGYTWVGGGPLYRDPSTGTILQMLHMEKWLSDGTHYYTQLALGRVDPSTQQTTYLGMIIQPTISYANANSIGKNVDLGAPTFVAQGGYLYSYFDDFYLQNNDAIMQTPVVARTSLSGAVSAAQKGQVTSWQKYTGSASWTSSAMGGSSTSLMPGQPQLWSPSTAYDSALGSTIMVSPVSSTEAVLTSSVDGLTNWAPQQPLFSDPSNFDAYYTLVGTGSDPSQLGRQFYLYYLQWQSPNRDWNNARILRRTVTCTAGQAATTMPLIRYTNGQRHIVTTSMISQPGYYAEHSGSWQMLTSAQPGTHPMYGCRLGTQDYFLYTQADCGGFAILQTEGWLYDSPPSVPNVALYRCYLASIGDHFVTASSTCENSGANNDGIIGYAPTSTKVVLSRYYNGSDHWDTTNAVTAAYTAQAEWLIEGSQQPGTQQIFTCQYAVPGGVEHFTSTQSTCEGATVVGSEGWLYTSPPAGTTAIPMYRCYDSAHYDHFLATTTTCDGIANVTAEGLLGYGLPLTR